MRRFSVYGSCTIFEVDGRFDAVDGTHERRQVFLEIEALLDHLFRHINTPVHMAKRVILRFVTSNPSPPTSDLW